MHFKFASHKADNEASEQPAKGAASVPPFPTFALPLEKENDSCVAVRCTYKSCQNSKVSKAEVAKEFVSGSRREVAEVCEGTHGRDERSDRSRGDGWGKGEGSEVEG